MVSLCLLLCFLLYFCVCLYCFGFGGSCFGRYRVIQQQPNPSFLVFFCFLVSWLFFGGMFWGPRETPPKQNTKTNHLKIFLFAFLGGMLWQNGREEQEKR